VVLQSTKFSISLALIFWFGTRPSNPPLLLAPSASGSAATAETLAALHEDGTPAKSACPSEMVHVAGAYCPEVIQTCKAYLDPPPYQNLRCAAYEAVTKCIKPRITKSFCIDREEHIDSGETLARVDISFDDAKSACEHEGKALCKEDEWQFACEGEEMRPYPYGFTRDSTACNIDQTHLGSIGHLRDLRAPSSAYERCLSPFGVHNMTGNVDEWADREGGAHHSVLHGGWWLPGRNRCRATTAEHGPEYSAKQVGYRCCKPAESSP
jgi:formylglycine-generating enzyme